MARRAIAPERVHHKVGSAPRRRMAEVDAALRRHLALRPELSA
ncbi:hypothetical protein [Streptomyces tubercidicus]